MREGLLVILSSSMRRINREKKRNTMNRSQLDEIALFNIANNLELAYFP